ncbi:MAG: sulfoxide reductase heme-binding subunit YedZ, partial [Acidobacteriaceae bacterium]|nr:sulfoxide reductase heme-binding subunit YedZ [Acidobacteriaceae bacterium]
LLKWIVFPLCLLPLALLVWFTMHQDLGADPVAEITHVTGHWTLYFLLLSLAVTPVRRLHPKLGWLIRYRRMLGLFAFFYATLHLCTYVFLFSDLDIPGTVANLKAHDWSGFRAQWDLPIATMKDDILRRKFIQVGLFSWALLLLLALTSPAWIMRKMGGRNWRWAHALVYVAAIAGVIHFWWLVKAGVHRPMKVTVVLAILLLARLVWWLQKKAWGRSSHPHAVC